MKSLTKTLFFAAAIFAFAACDPPIQPVDESITKKIGFCSNELEVVGLGTQNKYAAASLFPDTMLVHGKEIIAVRVGFYASSVSSAEIFITEDLEGEPLYTQSFQPIGFGWEYVKLNTPFKIGTHNNKLMIGYTVRGSNVVIGYNIGKTRNQNADYFWYKGTGTKEKWQHLSSTNYISRSYVCVQAFVAGGDYSNEKQYDLQIRDVEFEDYLKLGSENIIKGLVTNNGVKTLKEGFSVTYTDGTATQSVVIDKSLSNGETAEFTLPDITYSTKKDVSFTLTATPENVTNSGQNNTFTGSQMFYGDFFPRTILFEQFTGDQCGYCPSGSTAMHKSIVGNESKVAIVAHHVGYNEDKFTITGSRPMTWFYNANTTYAPAMMIDRRIIPQIDTKTPVFGPIENAKTALTNSQLATPAFVSVNLDVQYDEETRLLEVNVDGEFLVSYPNARLNVFLVQDSIIASQAGGGNEYSHMHAIRRFLSAASWGDAIPNTEGATYSKTYTYTIPPLISTINCVPKNMYVVAFVADYINTSAANIGKSEVRNTAFKKIIP